METVLRRAQIATFTNPALAANGKPKQIETVVPTPKTYRGVVGTIWSVVYEEGTSRKPDEAARILGKAQDERKTKRKGQGVEGLYRGWRVGMWGLVGVWGAGFLGGFSGGTSGVGAGAGGEF
jgi:mitochondrial fusion and transport protein UGO1